MPAWLRWGLSGLIFAMLTVIPFYHFRMVYTHSKRFREVDRGRLYRSGQLTSEGFADLLEQYHIRTVVNVQEDIQDPDVRENYFDHSTIKESEMCARLGVRYICIPTETVSRRTEREVRPATIDKFLEVMDDPANQPVLLHCKAGLHRTGVLSAIYRMEYEGWSKDEALHELQKLGFSELVCTPDNDYIRQYILTFAPGMRKHSPSAAAALTGARSRPPAN
jgi:protein tyrosine phosphatase (PTP) superfamily phosphohydrolase (DUF442 family)